MSIVSKIVTYDASTGEVVRERLVKPKSPKGEFLQLYYRRNVERLNSLGKPIAVYLAIAAKCAYTPPHQWTKITLEELKKASGVLSTSTLYKVIDRLQELNMITYENGTFKIDRTLIDR